MFMMKRHPYIDTRVGLHWFSDVWEELCYKKYWVSVPVFLKKSLSDYWKKDQTVKYVTITLKTSKAFVRISILVSTSGISTVYFHSGWMYISLI